MSENSAFYAVASSMLKGMSQEDIYYEALRSRDNRFDGKFFVGVKTTGVYCRPICPAKPKRKNVEFFKSANAAQRAGYRPCLRCRPESAPASAAWIGKSAIVNRALKKIQSYYHAALDEDEFAALFGVSARHLRRLFRDEIGKTPKQIFFENRLNLARKLVTETSLPLTQIAFASGFSSARRFNDAFFERFKRPPSKVRRMKLSQQDPLKLSLAYRPPFDFEGLLHFYRSHEVGNLEWTENGQFHRVIHMNGKTGKIIVSHAPARLSLELEIHHPELSIIPEAVARTRSMFDLDSDPLLLANTLESDPAIGELWKKHQGIRLPSGWDGFEIAIATILGQLVSVERGRALVHDLIEMLGEDSGLSRDGKKIKLFPTPQKIVSSDLSALKTTSMRKKTLLHFSKAILEGQISLEPTQDVNTFIQKILSIPGIGAWTAHYMSLKVLRNTDAFPHTDLILARALLLHPPESVAAMSPWRGYVAALLWREYADKLKKVRPSGAKPTSK